MAANNFSNGSEIMLYLVNDGGVMGYCTSNSFSATRNTEEISTKTHGESPAAVGNGYTWEATTDNLLVFNEAQSMLQLIAAEEPIDVIIGKPDNYTKKGLSSEGGSDIASWSAPSAGNIFAQGKAILDNFQLTADAGASGNYSCTFRGSGPLKGIGDEEETQGAHGAQGAQGAQGSQS